MLLCKNWEWISIHISFAQGSPVQPMGGGICPPESKNLPFCSILCREHWKYGGEREQELLAQSPFIDLNYLYLLILFIYLN